MEPVTQTQPRIINGFEEQDENGIDLSLLRENLKLTPEQRLDKLQAMVDFQWEVRRARIKAGLLPGIPE
jgi:hypothetical protein